MWFYNIYLIERQPEYDDAFGEYDLQTGGSTRITSRLYWSPVRLTDEEVRDRFVRIAAIVSREMDTPGEASDLLKRTLAVGLDDFHPLHSSRVPIEVGDDESLKQMAVWFQVGSWPPEMAGVPDPAEAVIAPACP